MSTLETTQKRNATLFADRTSSKSSPVTSERLLTRTPEHAVHEAAYLLSDTAAQPRFFRHPHVIWLDPPTQFLHLEHIHHIRTRGQLFGTSKTQRLQIYRRESHSAEGDITRHLKGEHLQRIKSVDSGRSTDKVRETWTRSPPSTKALVGYPRREP